MRRDDDATASGGEGEGRANPYVGPRPFTAGEPLFGRDRELAELQALVCAERVVVLHAPSGAGKSSLVQAGLVPRLRRRFDVWRPTRVGRPLPPDVPEDSNRYAVAAMLGLERGVREGLRRPAAALARLRLAEYVAGRPRRVGAPAEVLLVFDQFEEVFSVDPFALAARQAFFDQIGELLQDPRIWAVFSIREEYLARFDPYARGVPTHLRTRYRLDLLGLEAAREAIVRPAQAAGCAWTEAALDRLIHDLAVVKVQQPDGTFLDEVGVAVEPMQMQVVCRGLWARVPAERRVIDGDDVARFGDVGAALAGYYAAAVARVAGAAPGVERAVRAWVGEALIGAEGIRVPVLRTAGASEGLADEWVAGLVDAHLVRAEQREGATWYELAHDRLVGPVRADNARWTAEHLAPVQVQAAVWARQGEPAALLLSAEALAGAEAWAAGRTLDEPDASYLAASRAARAEERALHDAQARALAAAETVVAAQGRAARRMRVLLAVVAVVGAVAVLAAVQARRRAADAVEGSRQAAEAAAAEREEAVVAADQARMLAAREAEEPTVQAVLLREVERATDRTAWLQAAHDARTWPLAQALVEHDDSVLQVRFLADGRLLTASLDHRARIVAPGGGAPLVLQHAATVNRCAASPDGALVATASDDRTAGVWRADTGERVMTLRGHADEVWWVAFSPDGRRILTASKDRTARVWASDGAGDPVVLAGHDDKLLAAEWSPDGARVLTASVDGVVRVTRADGGGEPVVWAASRAALWAARFSPDGDRIVTAGADQTARVWRADGSGAPVVLDGHGDVVRRAVFSPDGRRVVTGTRDAKVWIWPADRAEMPRILHGLTGAITAIAFTPDGSRFAVATDHGEVKLAAGDHWTSFKGHTEGALDVAFSADGARLASAGWDPNVRVWRVADGDEPVNLYAGEAAFRAVALARDGRRIVGAAGREVRVWPTTGERAPVWLRGHTGTVLAAVFSPDGERVATGAEDRSVRVWRSDGAGAPVVLAEPEWGVQAIAWAPAGDRVAAAAHSAAFVWPSAGGAGPVRLRGHEDTIVGLAFSPDGARVLTASRDATARVWRADGGGEPVVLGASRYGLLSASFSPDGARVLTVGDDLRARVWRADGGGEPVELFGQHDGDLVSAAFTPDGAGVLTASSDGRALLWRADGVGVPDALVGHTAGLTSAVFSRDGALVVTGSEDQTARVWWRASGESLVLSSFGVGPVRGVDVSPDGARVLTWSDSVIRLWTLRSSAELQAHFWRATPYCLPAEQRVRRLGEPADEAARRAGECAARAAREAAR